MTYHSFIYEAEDGIATVRLNNPGQLNALTFETYEDLERLMRDLAQEDTVKVLVLTGTGKGFCSGGSVTEIIGRLLQMKGEALYRFTRKTCNVVQNMRNLKKPIIAAVNGVAAGAGAVLALASDFRFLSDRATLAFLFPKVGLSGADMGAIYLLPRLVGLGRATELLFLGETIDAQECHRIGLASRVIPHEQLMTEVYGFTRRLQRSPLHALGVTKELLYREAEVDLASALEMEARAQAKCMESQDFQEGYKAFIEKRTPVFNRS
jgi:enoyl-CoA hydratase/carnithine racemase